MCVYTCRGVEVIRIQNWSGGGDKLEGDMVRATDDTDCVDDIAARCV